MPGLAKLLKPVAAAYTHVAGYRQMGLKYDDLLMEEREDVQKVGRVWFGSMDLCGFGGLAGSGLDVNMGWENV